MGGQTALNCALDLDKHGVLKKYNVELIGANAHAIEKAEDRQKFKVAMSAIGLESAKSGVAHSLEEAWEVQKRIAAEIGTSGFQLSFVQALRSVGVVAVLPITPKNSKRFAAEA